MRVPQTLLARSLVVHRGRRSLPSCGDRLVPLLGGTDAAKPTVSFTAGAWQLSRSTCSRRLLRNRYCESPPTWPGSH